MDYDKSDIAATYDEARELGPARQRRWRDLLAAHVDRSTISLVVDLGCGTGAFQKFWRQNSARGSLGSTLPRR
jgi:ubiquinone/menaquinone biosynthesis C-methylase UbiE